MKKKKTVGELKFVLFRLSYPPCFSNRDTAFLDSQSIELFR